jgi:hypothetical protein
MSRRTAAGVAALLAATAATLGSTAFAATGAAATLDPSPPVTADGPVPLSPDLAEALATAPAAVPSGEATTEVSPADALAASTLPGADTSTDPGLTPAEAVGLPGDSSVSADASLLSTTRMCWADKGWYEWGTWPYDQRLTQTTYWCAVYGDHITYRTTTVTTGGTLCSTMWRASALIGGGIGFPGMTIRASAGYSCPTVIPWLTLHPSRHLDIFFGDARPSSCSRSSRCC